jgi:hypothetical protein
MNLDASCELCGAQPPTNSQKWRERGKAADRAGFLVVWEHDGWNGGLHTAHLFCPTCKERVIPFVEERGVIDNRSHDRYSHHRYHAIRPMLQDWIDKNCAPELIEEN